MHRLAPPSRTNKVSRGSIGACSRHRSGDHSTTTGRFYRLICHFGSWFVVSGMPGGCIHPFVSRNQPLDSSRTRACSSTASGAFCRFHHRIASSRANPNVDSWHCGQRTRAVNQPSISKSSGLAPQTRQVLHVGLSDDVTSNPCLGPLGRPCVTIHPRLHPHP